VRVVFLQQNTLQTKECNAKGKKEEKEKISAKKEKENLTPAKIHRDNVLLDSIWTYAMIMYAYLIDNLFSDKKYSFSDDYKIKTINYIAQNYFAQSQNGIQCVLSYEKYYKIGIDIAKSYIKNFRKKSGREFDVKDFHPLAYLNVNDCEGHFRFRNVYPLLQRNTQFKALNEHKNLKKSIENEQGIKFYNIIRQVENQKITYEIALEKVRSINMDEQIFTLMLNAKFTGEMSRKYTKRKFN